MIPELLQTLRQIIYEKMESGTYSYLGLENAVKRLMGNYNLEKIELLNVDGLPLSKSSRSHVYSILCSLADYPRNVSMIAIYHSNENLENWNAFLKDFVEDIIKFTNEGLTYKGRNISFQIKGFICDAPTKSAITYCKSHTAFYACTKCMQKGKYMQNRVTYPDLHSSKKTHTNFICQSQRQHHNGK